MSSNRQQIWEHLRWSLKDNFPNDSEEELDMKLRTLQNNEFYNEDFEIYMPNFRGIVLRVGIVSKENNSKKSFFITEAGYELLELLE